MPTTITNSNPISITNYLKNPNFAVIQSAVSGTLANSLALPTASLGYLGETEWCIAASGGTPAYAFSVANENITFTGAISTTAIHLLQRLESRSVNKLKSKVVTLSCEISNSLLTSVTWELFNPTTTDDIHGTISTPTQTSIATGTFTVTPTLSRYSITVTLPTTVSRGLEVRLRVGAQVSGTWVVARLQLEEGGLANSFTCNSYPEELRKCQRHFYQGIPSAKGVASLGGADRLATIHPADMFIAPIIAMTGNLSIIDGFVLATINSITNYSTSKYLEFDAVPSVALSRGANVSVIQFGSALLSVSAHIP